MKFILGCWSVAFALFLRSFDRIRIENEPFEGLTQRDPRESLSERISANDFSQGRHARTFEVELGVRLGRGFTRTAELDESSLTPWRSASTCTVALYVVASAKDCIPS
jgi:hypothetical protein